MFTNHIYLIYIYKQALALNNLQCLICLKTQPNENLNRQTKVFLLKHKFCELNYHDQKIRQTLACDIRKHWTAVSTLLGHHQQCISWSLPLEIEPVTTECRAETLPQSQQFTLQTSDTKLTSHGNSVVNLPGCVL